MRVGVDIRPLCVPTTGIGRYTREILDRLIDVPETEWFLYADRPVIDGYLDRENVTECSFMDWNRAKSLYRSQRTFSRWALADRLDVFWSPRHHLPLALPRGLPTIVTIHDMIWRVCPETMMVANRWVESVLMPRSVARADRIICVSSSTRADLLAWRPELEDKTQVVPLAANKRDVAIQVPDKPVFFFIGTMEPRKNLSRLVEAFGRLRARGVDARLVIAGGAGWRTSIQSVISAHGLNDCVDVLGRIDDTELHTRLAGATALCLPSLYEGFGLPALEAMQYGTPVVGSDRSSVPEVVGGGGLLVDPYSVPAIERALFDIATDPDLRERLSKAALAQARRFSWDESAAATLATIRALVDAGATRSTQARWRART